jgi:hypothetical protein
MKTMQLTNGQKITVIFINGLFQTVKAIMIITGKDQKGYYGYYRGMKRKHSIYVPNDGLVFQGQKVPLKIHNQLEGRYRLGNAQLNIMVNDNANKTREWIKQNNINDQFSEGFRLRLWKQNAKIITLSQQNQQKITA